jgi:DNA-binding transcriptional ArsR family regulator
MTRKNRLKAKIAPFVVQTQAIADPIRLSIVYILSHGPCDVREMRDVIGDVSAPLLSHHLTILKKAGWVHRSMFGKRAEYALEVKQARFLFELFKDNPLETEILPKPPVDG